MGLWIYAYQSFCYICIPLSSCFLRTKQCLAVNCSKASLWAKVEICIAQVRSLCGSCWDGIYSHVVYEYFLIQPDGSSREASQIYQLSLVGTIWEGDLDIGTEENCGDSIWTKPPLYLCQNSGGVAQSTLTVTVDPTSIPPQCWRGCHQWAPLNLCGGTVPRWKGCGYRYSLSFQIHTVSQPIADDPVIAMSSVWEI